MKRPASRAEALRTESGLLRKRRVSGGFAGVANAAERMLDLEF